MSRDQFNSDRVWFNFENLQYFENFAKYDSISVIKNVDNYWNRINLEARIVQALKQLLQNNQHSYGLSCLKSRFEHNRKKWLRMKRELKKIIKYLICVKNQLEAAIRYIWINIPVCWKSITGQKATLQNIGK